MLLRAGRACGGGAGRAQSDAQVKRHVFGAKDGAGLLHSANAVVARMFPAEKCELLAVQRLHANLKEGGMGWRGVEFGEGER